ncbi:Uncharacterised protein [Vibrio cholerae]|nr:Uncharacterised protein [Vibrio cholerae]
MLERSPVLIFALCCPKSRESYRVQYHCITQLLAGLRT